MRQRCVNLIGLDGADRDQSGTLDFREILCGLSSALRCTDEQKREFYWKLYDSDGDGNIGRAEVVRMLERGHRHSSRELNGKRLHELLDQAGLADVDQDGNGTISHEEFMKATKSNPDLLRSFGQCL